MDDHPALRVQHLSKSFKLPHEKHSTLKSAILNPFSKRKTYERQQVLKDVSFEVKHGEFFGIVGRNGGGKSTLLKLIASIYAPDKGSVNVEGKLVPFIELGVGFNPELTGRDNVYLNGALLGFSDREIDEVYDDIVAFSELEKFMDQKLKNYSSGMQVRLAFSVATHSKADILLVDEVLAVGDASFQRKCFNYFSTLKKQKKTVIFISHDMTAVREYCDRAMLVENGEIVETGKTDKITEAYARLFMETEKHVSQSTDSGDRWGDKTAEIQKISAKITPKELVIEETIKFHAEFSSPVAGIRIRSAKGYEVTGTNTRLERKDLPEVKAGDIVQVTWHIPNIFSDGQFIIDPAVNSSDGVTVCDWWNEAITFTNDKERVIPYITDPGFNITHKKLT